MQTVAFSKRIFLPSATAKFKKFNCKHHTKKLELKVQMFQTKWKGREVKPKMFSAFSL